MPGVENYSFRKTIGRDCLTGCLVPLILGLGGGALCLGLMLPAEFWGRAADWAGKIFP